MNLEHSLRLQEGEALFGDAMDPPSGRPVDDAEAARVTPGEPVVHERNTPVEGHGGALLDAHAWVSESSQSGGPAPAAAADTGEAEHKAPDGPEQPFEKLADDASQTPAETRHVIASDPAVVDAKQAADGAGEAAYSGAAESASLPDRLADARDSGGGVSDPAMLAVEGHAEAVVPAGGAPMFIGEAAAANAASATGAAASGGDAAAAAGGDAAAAPGGAAAAAGGAAGGAAAAAADEIGPSTIAVGDDPNLAAALTNATLGTLADWLQEGFWDWIGGFERSFNMGGGGVGANNGVLYYDYNGFAGVAGPVNDPDGLTLVQRDLVDAALDYYGEILGINFILNSAPPGGVDIYFGNADSGNYANHSLYGSGNGTADHRYIDYAWINLSVSSTSINSQAYETTVHELGHVFGLGHQGPYNFSATFVETDTAPNYGNGTNLWLNDSELVSVMTYFDLNENPHVDGSWVNQFTPMQADHIALQRYYGNSAFSGNTTYGFNTNITSTPLADLATLATTSAFSITDTGGTDTLDFSGYAFDQTINLGYASEGSSSTLASSVGGEINNMTIAVGTIIENALGGSGDDTIIGNNANNVLTGNAGNDVIKGIGGGDTLYGNAGADTMDGGDGNDFLYGANGVDGSGDLSSNEMSGGDGNDFLRGGDGDDELDGGDDNDEVRGNAGNDSMDGGAGIDEADYYYATSGVTVNLATGLASGGDGNDTLANFENIGGSNSHGDSLTGNSGANVILGLGGNDTINDGGGSDSVNGGSGNDRIVMGDSSANGDIYDGSSGTDTFDASHYTWAVNVTIDLTAESWSFNGNSEQVLNFENIEGANSNSTVYEILRGSAGANVINGNGGTDYVYGLDGSDTMDGGSGNDYLNGGTGIDDVSGGTGDDTITHFDAGADTYDGGAGIDLLINTVSLAQGVVIDLLTGLYTFGSFTLSWANFENYDGAGAGTASSEDIYGTNDANFLQTAGGTNEIFGLGGADTIYAGAGDDYLDGGGSRDDLYGGSGNDTMDGGVNRDDMWGSIGDDIYYVDDSKDRAYEFAGQGEDLVIATANTRLRDNVENLDLAGAASDDLTGQGNSLDNVITGDGGDNTLRGRGGDDTISGLSGDDVLQGEGGNDDLSGGGGEDTLAGGNGDDVLDGGTADDILNGGDRNDTLTGGGGADVFRFLDDFGRDDILDFEDGVDTINLRDIREENGNVALSFDQLLIVQNGLDARIFIDLDEDDAADVLDFDGDGDTDTVFINVIDTLVATLDVSDFAL